MFDTIMPVASMMSPQSPAAVTVEKLTNVWPLQHPPPPIEAAPPRTHVVQRGETLTGIARRHAVSLPTLIAENAIEDPDRIAVGRRLVLPADPSARGPLASARRPGPVATSATVGTVPSVPTESSAGTDSSAGTVPTDVTSDDPVLTAAFRWPVPGGRVLSPFGALRNGRPHAGVDIGGRPGQDVLAAHDGQVVFAGILRGYGQTVIVDHGSELHSLYAHNRALLVEVGETVLQGQPIAELGRTGNATTEHCHFEVRRRDVPLDPLPLSTRSEAGVEP